MVGSLNIMDIADLHGIKITDVLHDYYKWLELQPSGDASLASKYTFKKLEPERADIFLSTDHSNNKLINAVVVAAQVYVK